MDGPCRHSAVLALWKFPSCRGLQNSVYAWQQKKHADFNGYWVRYRQRNPPPILQLSTMLPNHPESFLVNSSVPQKPDQSLTGIYLPFPAFSD